MKDRLSATFARVGGDKNNDKEGYPLNSIHHASASSFRYVKIVIVWESLTDL